MGHGQSLPAPEARAAHWADLFAGLLHREIDAGRLVRIALPGAQVPILVEDAHRWTEMLVVKDPQGRLYYVGSTAGLVVLCEPTVPPAPGEKPFWMSVDGD